MVIYKYTNKINGKVYIGQTIDEESRKLSHLKSVKYGSNCAFHNAIRLYGIENFEYEVIDGANSASELTYKEIHYIHQYKSLSPNGYNLRLGNQSCPANERPVIAINEYTGREIIYKSVSHCERALGIARNTVYEILNGKREYSSRNGYYFKYVDSAPIKKIIKVKEELKVKRICNKTKEEKIYNSANSTKIDGFNPDSVRNACQRSRKGYERNRTVGYRWEYLSE